MLNLKQYGSIVVSFYLIVTPAYALPTGAKVAHGDAKFKVEQNKMQITTSDKTIINYRTFNIGSREIVQFIQPSSHSIVLNRVITSNPSSILGTLNANGRVFLINPSGIIFGRNSHINVNGLIATTLNISDKDFLNSNYKFSQLKNMPKSFIIQSGNIHVSNNGFVVLAAPFVKNNGVIIARRGIIHIGAVDNFYINFDRKGVVMFSYHPSTTTNNQDNNIVLSQEAAQNIIINVLNTSAIQKELKLVKEGGVIKLINGSGHAIISGKLVTSSKNKAGKVDIVAQKFIELRDLQVLADALDNGKGGNIYIFSNGSAYGNSAVLLSAKGGKLFGDGGFIEFSAKDAVVMNGMQVDTSALNGKSGIFYVDPGIISIEANEFFNTNPQFEASDFILRKGHFITSAENTDISLYAQNIILEDNTRIKSGGDLLLQTTTKDGDEYRNVSIIIGNGVEISGKNVYLKAIANDEASFDPTRLDSYTDAGSIANFIGGMPNLPVAFKFANASSTISIGNSRIIASNDINIKSESNAQVELEASSVGISLAFGEVSAISTINLNNSILNADNDVIINSIVNTTNLTSAESSNADTKAKANLAFAYAVTQTVANTNINNSYINAGNDILVKANAFKDVEIAADAITSDKSVLGAAVAMSKSNSNIKSNLSGQIIAGNQVNVESTTDIQALAVKSTSEYEEPETDKKKKTSNIQNVDEQAQSAENVLTQEINQINPSANSKGSSKNSKLGLSAAVSYSKHTNTNEATISKDANVVAKNGDIDVNSNINYYENGVGDAEDSGVLIGYYGIKTSAIASVDGSKKKVKANSLSGGVVLTDITNNSKAYIADGAVLNSFNGDINVNALTSIKYNLNWGAFDVSTTYQTPEDTSIVNLLDIVDNISSTYSDNKDDLTGFRNNLFTTFAQSDAEGSEYSIAGTYNSFKLTNNTSAYIEKDVLINRDVTNTNYQNVNVIAKNDVDTINFAGVIGWNFGLKSPSTKVGVGGSYLDSQYTDNVKAYIDERTQLNANTLVVNAEKNGNNFSLATAGGKSDYAISGSMSDLLANDQVYAYINQAKIYTRDGANDDNNNISINASDNLEFFNGSGGVTLGKSVGVGASLSRNTVNRDTLAYISNNTDIDSISKDKQFDVTAQNTGSIGAYTLSAVAVSPSTSTDVTTSNNSADAQSISSPSNSNSSSSSSKVGVFGIALSGESGLNYINDNAKAYVENSRINNNADLSIQAYNLTDYIGLSGGASLDPGTTSGVGISGSYTANYLQNDTEAYIKNSNLNVNNLSLSSKNSGNSIIYTASLSGGSGAVNLAGSVGIEELTNSAQSYIQDSDLALNGNLDITALNDMNIENYAGGVGISKYVGVGLAYVSNKLTNNTHTYMDSSRINNSYPNVNMVSNDLDKINTIAVGGALGLKGLAASAAIINNSIQNDIQSYISANNAKSSIIGFQMTINSLDNTNINSQAGFVGVSKLLGVGGGFIRNNISNTLNSYISKSVVQDFILNVSSISNKKIDGIVAGGSGAIVGLAGSNIYNDMKDTISSSITDSVVDSNSIVLHSIEQNTINSESGLVSIGLLGMNAALNHNSIYNNISSFISNSNIIVNGYLPIISPDLTNIDYDGLSILALANENITMKSTNGGYGGENTNGNLNNLYMGDTLNSYISDSNVNKDINNIGKDQDVLVVSAFNNNILSQAGAFAISFGVGEGASVSNIYVENSTNSYISNSYVKAKNNVNVETRGNEQILPEIVSGSASVMSSLAGSVSIINMENKNNASIKDGSIVLSNHNINVKSTDYTFLGYQDSNPSKYGITVGAIGLAINPFGGNSVAGVGASMSVNHIKNSSIVDVKDSTLNATSYTDLISENKASIINTILSGAVSAEFTGVGSSVINNISSITQTNITNDMINQDPNYMGDLQSIIMRANDNSYVQDTLGAAEIGAGIGVGASVDVTTMHNLTNVNISNQNNMFAKYDINILTGSKKTFKSEAAILGISGLAVANGAVIVGNLDNHKLLSLKEFNDATSITNSYVTDVINWVDDTSTAISNLFGTGETSSTGIKIGNNVNINAGHRVNLFTSNSFIDTTVHAGSVADAAEAVGAAIGIVYFGGDNTISIGDNDKIYGKDILINTLYDIKNYDKPDDPEYIGTGTVVPTDIITRNAAVSSFVSLAAAYTKVYNNYNDTISTGTSDEVIAANDIKIFNKINENISAVAQGLGVSGIVSIGGSLAGISSDNARIRLAIGQGSNFFANRNIQIANLYTSNLSATTNATGVSVGVGVQGAITNIDYTPYVNLYVGALMRSINNTIYTSINNNVKAQSNGLNISSLSAGVSQATAKFNPSSSLTIKGPLYTDNDLKIQNYLNTYTYNDAIITNSGVSTSATSSTGGLLTAAGAESSSTFNPILVTNINNYLRSLNNITIKTKSYVNALATSSANAYGELAGGITKATIDTSYPLVMTYINNDILAENDIWIDNYANVHDISNSTGGKGGILTVSGTESNIIAANENFLSILNSGYGPVKILSNKGSVNILATNDTHLDSTATDNSASLISLNEVKSEVDVSNQIVDIYIANADIQSNNDLNIIANQQREFEHSTATTYITAAGGKGTAEAILQFDDARTISDYEESDGQNLGEVDLIMTNVNLRAKDITLQSAHNPYDYRDGEHTLDAQTFAKAGISLSVAGFLTAISHNESRFVEKMDLTNVNVNSDANYILKRGIEFRGYDNYSAVYGNLGEVDNHSILYYIENVVNSVIDEVESWFGKDEDTDKDYIINTTAKVERTGGWDPTYINSGSANMENIDKIEPNLDSNTWWKPALKNGILEVANNNNAHDVSPDINQNDGDNDIDNWWDNDDRDGSADETSPDFKPIPIVNSVIIPNGFDLEAFMRKYKENFLYGINESVEMNNFALALNLITKKQESIIFNYKFAPMISQAMFSANVTPLINPIEIPGLTSKSSMVQMPQDFNMWNKPNNNIGGKKNNKVKKTKNKK